MDSYVPTPERRFDLPFLMPVEGVHTISGRGTVLTGAVERGVLQTGSPVEMLGSRSLLTAVVTAIETLGRFPTEARAGDDAALLLRGIRRHEVRRGQVVAVPGSVQLTSSFTAELRVLTAAEAYGGPDSGPGIGRSSTCGRRTSSARSPCRTAFSPGPGTRSR